MKKVFILLLVLSSCVVKITHYPEDLRVGITDFRPYAEKGFFFSPYTYNGEFVALAQLTFTFSPEMEFVTEGGDTKTVREQRPPVISYWAKISDPNRLLDLVYKHCIELGADAFVDFQFTRRADPRGFDVEIINGFAIKRGNP